MSSVQEILAGYDGLQAAQEAFYRDLHQHPELSHQEQRTAQRIAGQLQRYGCTVQAGIGGTGVVGMLSNGDGPTVLLRADMDALPAMIVVRLQTVVSRELAPSQTAVLTVGSSQAGTKSNVIPDYAVLQLNRRSYSQQTRRRMLDAIRRIVRAECQAAGSPRDPDFQALDSFPLTDNDAGTTRRVAGVFGTHFGDPAVPLDQQTASEDFSDIPRAAGIPYTYWGNAPIAPEAKSKE